MKNKNRGFTLVELLAVIVILAIIMVIAIPSVMNTTTSAKKESFYLYAQSLHSKAVGQYTQDLEHKLDTAECVVYDIGKDLGLSNTGKYEGWVMVKREIDTNAEGSRKVKITVDPPGDITLSYVHYCIKKGGACVPDKTFYVPENSKSLEVDQVIEKNYQLCVNFQYPQNNKLTTSQTICKPYSEGELVNKQYVYKVKLSLKDSDYAVENVTMSEEMSQQAFYTEIDKYRTANPQGGLVIHTPSCTGDVGTDVKGTTTARSTIYNSTTASTTRSTEYNTTSGSTTRKTDLNTTTTTTTRNTDYNTTSSTTTRSTEFNTTTTIDPNNPNKTTQLTTSTTVDPTDPNRTTLNTTTTIDPTDPNKTTQIEPTTTINIQDTSLLLNTLNVSGYNIGFSPLKFYYELTVPNDVTTLNVSATPAIGSTQFMISGDTELKVGKNPVVVRLQSENGDVSYYRIFVERLGDPNKPKPTTTTKSTTAWDPNSGTPDPMLDESNASLRLLTISGYYFDFSPDVYEYTIETKGEDKLSISMTAQSKNAITYIVGNENLTDGSVIEVKVKSANQFYTKVYKITVKFKKEETKQTKYIKGIAIGLGVILISLVMALQFTKKKKSRVVEDVFKQETNTVDNITNNINNNNSGN